MINAEIIRMAKSLWDFHHMNHILKNCDCILALGSHDLRVAERAADLYLDGFAPLLIFSGGFGNYTKGKWEIPEADQFAAIAEKKGVPRENILIENKSSNTGENILFTRQLLIDKKLIKRSFILVQKPYMEKRSYATFMKLWPNLDVVVTSPQIGFDEYAINEKHLELEINIMVGDIQRIKCYPEKGFQIYQEIPLEIWYNYEQLVNMGFNKHLIKN